MQPDPRRLPVTLHRRRRQFERLRGFVDGEAGEVAQLDDAALVGIDASSPASAVSSRPTSMPSALSGTSTPASVICSPPSRFAAPRRRA